MISIEQLPVGAVIVRARIRFLTTAEGGRMGPVFGSYRPNHNFYDADSMMTAMGFIEIPPDHPWQLGETRDVEMWLLTHPDVALAPGREWRIQEGRKLVATGTIVEILETRS